MKIFAVLLLFCWSALGEEMKNISTTSASNNVSTNAPVTSMPITDSAKPTTIKPTTTTAPQTTKPAPEDALNTYSVKKGNETCLMAKFKGHFKSATDSWVIGTDAKVDASSSCNHLMVKFHGGNFTIVFNDTTSQYYISGISAELKKAGDKTLQTDAQDLDVAKASNGSSYMCMSGITVDMSKNVTLTTTNFQVQAFDVPNGKFSTARKCETDLSPIVPIIVGAVLAGLVIIVVVAYFVGRNRNRVGYEEI